MESLGLAQVQEERVTLVCEYQGKAFLPTQCPWLALKIKLSRTDDQGKSIQMYLI